jgi:hypothetical protein
MSVVDISSIKYSLPNNLVWGIHIIIGLFFISISAVYLSYMDKNSKDIPFNLDLMNESIYIILIIFGSLMFLYHGHLFIKSKGYL